MQYAARAVPALSLDAIKSYQPVHPAGPSSSSAVSVYDVLSRLHARPEDDGHAIKLSRAAAICQEFTKKYEDRDWVLLKGDDIWMRIHHLIVDSVEAPGPTWVRTTGLDQSWEVSHHVWQSDHEMDRMADFLSYSSPPPLEQVIPDKVSA